jgi:hypothetical protein
LSYHTDRPERWAYWGSSRTGLFGNHEIPVLDLAPVPAFLGLDQLTIHPFTYHGEHIYVVGSEPNSVTRAY